MKNTDDTNVLYVRDQDGNLLALGANRNTSDAPIVSKQRDVLLAALKEIANSYPITDEGEVLAGIARAAIKAVET